MNSPARNESVTTNLHLTELSNYMTINYLHINEIKTILINNEYKYNGIPYLLNTILMSPHDDTLLTLTDYLTMTNNINEIKRQVNYQLINLCKIQKSRTLKITLPLFIGYIFT